MPFTIEQFLGVFVAYNTTVWPAQILLNLLGIAAILLCFRAPSRLVPAILAGLWIWTGVVYQILFFSTVNPAAILFGALCIVQGGLFLWFGVARPGVELRFKPGWRAYTGAGLLLYGLVIYPILGYVLGHQYPASPTFGVPCPTTIFTFGLLLWTTRRVRWFLFALPFIWSLIGFTAALTLGIREDIGLLLSGVVGTIILATMHDSPGGITHSS